MAVVVLLFAVAGAVMFAAGTAWPWVSASGAFNGVVALFLLLTAIGSRRLHVTVSDEGVEFTLPRPGNVTLMPWMLLTAKVRWNEIHAVDLRERNVIINKLCYILRTTAGDAFFFAPSWSDAEQLAEEIVQRSGCTTSYDDLLADTHSDPSRPSGKAKTSIAEKAAHVLGVLLAVAVGLAALLLLIAAFVGGPEGRSGIWFALFVLWIPAMGACALMSFRRMR